MKFLDFDKEAIRCDSKLEGSHYVYTVGSPIEVTAIRKLHKNELLARKLSNQVTNDKLMTKYSPTNKVYFSQKVLENESPENFVSCFVDNKNCSLYIGAVEDYGSASGILTFSGYLSLNRLLEEHKRVLCTSRMRATVMSRVRILSLGLIGEDIFGLMYIPGVKGIKIAERGELDMGVSPITYRVRDCTGYQSFTINDWFDDLTRIKEV